MLYDDIVADATNTQLNTVNMESTWADNAFASLASSNERHIRQTLPLLQARTSFSGRRSAVLNSNAFETDFNRAVTLSMEGAGDLAVTVYLKVKKVLQRILEAIKAFIKKARDFIFGNKAKKAEQEKVAITAVKASDAEINIAIPQSKVSDFAWFMQDENRPAKDTYRLEEVLGNLSKKLEWLEDVLFDFRGNAAGIGSLLDRVKDDYNKRQYQSAKDEAQNAFREKFYRKIKHFGDNPGLLYIETKRKGTPDEFDVLKRNALVEGTSELVLTIRPGNSQDVKNLFSIDKQVTALIDVMEKTYAELDAVVGDKKGGSKIENLFKEVNDTKRNNAKKKSMETLVFVKQVFNNQIMGMVESLNNVAFVTNKMLSSINIMTEQLSAEAPTAKPSTESDSGVEDNSAALTGAFDLYSRLIDGKTQTDESFQAISENMKLLGELVNKTDWTKPVVIGGKHYLEPTVNASIDSILRTVSQLRAMGSQLVNFNQGATAITRTQFAEINKSMAGLRMMGVFWGSDGVRHEAQPTQANITTDKEGMEALVEELTGLLLALIDCHDIRFGAVSAVHQMASQAMTARSKGEYYREEDLDLMLAGFDFFDSAFCVNLIAGRLNDTVSAIHSSITIAS